MGKIKNEQKMEGKKNSLAKRVTRSTVLQKNSLSQDKEALPGSGKPHVAITTVLLADRIKPGKTLSAVTKKQEADKGGQRVSPDYVDGLIDQYHLKIDKILIDKKNDHLFFVLNSGLTIQDNISRYPLLRKASTLQLKKYSLYAGGTCIEWKMLDEDLSLRGLLKQTLFEPLMKSLCDLEGFVLSAG